MNKIPTDVIRIEDALSYIQHVQEIFKPEMERKDLMAVCYGIMVIGEALSQVSEQLRNRYTEIKWRKIIDTRNRIIHGYGSVDKEIVASIASEHLPELQRQLNDLLLTIQPSS